MTRAKRKYTSASAISTASQCQRKWFIEKVCKLATPPFSAGAFGTVFHAVLERYFLNQELYPKGWFMYREDFGKGFLTSVNRSDQQLIISLATAGIEGGYLEHTPGTQVELPIRRKLWDAPNVTLMGSIDKDTDFGIEDHKTSSNTRYLLSPDDLLSDIQMTIYARDWLDRHPKEPSVNLRHNQFVKRPPRADKASIDAPRDFVLSTYQEKITPVVIEMLSYWDLNCEPLDIPGDESGAMCQKYGGCPWAEACNGGCTLEILHQRHTVMQAEKNKEAAKIEKKLLRQQGESKMPSLKDILAAKGASGVATTPSAGATVAPAAQAGGMVMSPAAPVAAAAIPVAAAAIPVAAAQGDRAPWGVVGCSMCSGKGPLLGLKADGNPCPLCSARTSDVSMKPDNFDVTVDAMGSISITQKCAAAPAAAVAAPVPPAASAPPPAVTIAPEKVAAGPAVHAAPAAQAPAPIAGDPVSKGFILVINAVPYDVKFGATVSLADVISAAQESLAQDPAYVGANTFDKRDMIAAHVKAAVSGDGSLDGDFVVAPYVSKGTGRVEEIVIRELMMCENCNGMIVAAL